MASYAMYDTVQKVLDNFSRCKHKFYCVCDSKGEILWKCEDAENMEDAIEQLKNDLAGIREYNTQIFTIKHFASVPAKGIKKTSEADCISTYKRSSERFTDDEKEAYKSRRNYFEEKLLDKIEAMQLAQQEMQLKLSQSDDEIEVEAETEPKNILAGFLGNPKVQDVLANFLTNIAANFVNPPPPVPGATLRGIAGTDTWETVIDRLLKKGVTFEDMVKLSNMENGQISMLLTMLRNQP